MKEFKFYSNGFELPVSVCETQKEAVYEITSAREGLKLLDKEGECGCEKLIIDVIYKDGSTYYNSNNYKEEGKFKRTGIARAMVSTEYGTAVFGDFAITEYGDVTIEESEIEEYGVYAGQYDVTEQDEQEVQETVEQTEAETNETTVERQKDEVRTMKKMTKAERIYEATRRECKDIITGTHGYLEGQRLLGLVTEEVVCMRTINAIMKLVDKEEHRIRLDEKLGVLSGEKLQLYINVNNMVRSTVENVKKSLKKFLDDLKPNSEYSKWLDERVEAMEAQEEKKYAEMEVEQTEVEETAETETVETAEQEAMETVEGISKTETTTGTDDSGKREIKMKKITDEKIINAVNDWFVNGNSSSYKIVTDNGEFFPTPYGDFEGDKWVSGYALDRILKTDDGYEYTNRENVPPLGWVEITDSVRAVRKAKYEEWEKNDLFGEYGLRTYAFYTQNGYGAEKFYFEDEQERTVTVFAGSADEAKEKIKALLENPENFEKDGFAAEEVTEDNKWKFENTVYWGD